jgi:hypothetical protein
MAHHRLIHPALTLLQADILFGVAEERFHRPAAPFAAHHRRQVAPHVVTGQEFFVAVTVPGHDHGNAAMRRGHDRQGDSLQAQLGPPMRFHKARQQPQR